MSSLGGGSVDVGEDNWSLSCLRTMCSWVPSSTEGPGSKMQINHINMYHESQKVTSSPNSPTTWMDDLGHVISLWLPFHHLWEGVRPELGKIFL